MNKLPRHPAQTGMTLIEVLVAVLVLAIGLLGLAALQMTGLKSNHSAYHRSQATLLAHDIIERMRVNRRAALDGAYDTANCASTADCSAWQGSVSALLGTGATGTITRSDNTVEVRIAWDDSRGGIRKGDGTSSDSTVTFVYKTEI